MRSLIKNKMFKILIRANKGEMFPASGHSGWKITSKRALGKNKKGNSSYFAENG